MKPEALPHGFALTFRIFILSIFFLCLGMSAIGQTSPYIDKTPGGTETFTVPSGVTIISVEAWGAGGGSGGFGTTTATAGGTGGSTTIDGLTAGGGSGSAGALNNTPTTGGAGGTATGGSTNTSGSNGTTGTVGTTSTGGNGGACPGGGGTKAGSSSTNNVPAPGTAGNEPGGGAGGGAVGTNPPNPPASARRSTGGGGGGAYSFNTLTVTPGQVISYSVGTGGTAGNGNTGNGGAGANGQIRITWTACPSFTLTSTSATTPLCAGGTSTVTFHSINIPTGTYTVNYSFSAPNAGSHSASVSFTGGNPGSGTFTTASLPNSGTTTVTITDIIYTGCDISITANNTAGIIVNPILPVSVTLGASPNPSCTGGKVTFTATPVNGGGSPSYAWWKNGSLINSVTGDTYSYIPVNGDQLYVILTSSEACTSGNPATSGTVTMTVNPLPAAVLSGAGTICIGGSTSLTVELTGKPPFSFTYTANGSDPVTVNGVTSPYSLVVSPSTNTTYAITGVTDDNGCSGTGSGSAMVYVGPVTIAPTMMACPGLIAVPVIVNDFDIIGAISLTLKYDRNVMTYDSYNADASLIDFVIGDNNTGYVRISGTPVPTASRPDGYTLITLYFNYSGGTSYLAWDDSDDIFCEYGSGEPDFVPYCDNPPETYYINGSVSQYPEPIISFAFNGVEAGWNASFTYCEDQPVTVTLYHVYAGTEPFSVTYTLDGGPEVTVAGLYEGDPLNTPATLSPGTHTIAVTNITDANGCESGPEFLALCQATILINALPEVTDVTLRADVGAAPSTWNWPVGGVFPDFDMCIDPLSASDYFLDINTLTASIALQPDFMNPFFLVQAGLPATFWQYWEDKGVDGINNAQGWELTMWDIITGTDPFFFIKLTTGGDYILVDGLQYQLGGGEPILRVPGDYPEFNYNYQGTVKDVNGCVSSFFDVFFQFNSIQDLVADFSADNLTPPKNTTVTFTNLSTGTNVTYAWTITPGTFVYVGNTGASSFEPQIQFTNGGLYSVSLTVSDVCGNNTETRVGYIRAGIQGLWIGRDSEEWTTSGNWDNDLVPDNGTDVMIQVSAKENFWPKFTGDLLVGIDPSAHCKSITFDGTGYLLTVKGTMTTVANGLSSTVRAVSGGTGNIRFETP